MGVLAWMGASGMPGVQLAVRSAGPECRRKLRRRPRGCTYNAQSLRGRARPEKQQ